MEKQVVAKKIKELRVEQQLSLRAVGQKAGITAAMISMIENSKVSPTLATLHKILVALGTDFGEFFSKDERPSENFHFPKNKMEAISNRKRKYTILLPRNKDIKIQVVLEEISPGDNPEIETHEVDVAGYILKGGPLKLEVVGKGERLIYKGDAFYVAAGNPHQGSNAGKNTMEMITCYYPARY